MATIVLVWELGGGLGHLTQLRPLALGLLERGHRVAAAVKDLPRARAVFGAHPVALFQAPVKPRPCDRPIPTCRTFAHILHNVGFGQPAELAAMTEAWRNLYRCLRPGGIIFDHSPTALLAARGLNVRRVVVGSGFCVPPDQHPLPDLRPYLRSDPQRLPADEDRILACINRVLHALNQPALRRIT